MEYLLPLSLAAIVVNFRAALVLLALALAVGFWQGYVPYRLSFFSRWRV